MLELNGKKIESIYFNNQKINRYYFNGVVYEFYKPYIEYKWSDTITRNGLQEIENSGTFELGLSQYFGQGVLFNGVDQAISIGSVPVSDNMTLAYSFVPTTNSRILGRGSDWNAFVGFSSLSGTEGVVRCRFTGTDTVFTYRLTLGVPYNIILVLKPDVIDLWVNGILRESVPHTYTFAHSLEFIGRNSTAFANCVIKDIYVYNKHLTQTEIEKYSNQPNQFFMDALEDDTCVLAMPMCEKDGYVRNYKSYAEGNDLVINGDFANASFWNLGGWTINNNTLVSPKNNGAKCTQPINFAIGTTIELSVDLLSISGGSFRLYERDGAFGNLYLIGSFMTTPGKYVFLHMVQSANFVLNLYDGDTNCIVDNVVVKQVSGAYQITNFTTACRTNAQRLSYGLQTSGFKRDSLGKILSKSNFLEGDGVGFADIRYASPMQVVPESFEFIIEKPKVVQSSFSKYVCGGGSSGDMVVEISSNSDTNGYVRLRKVGRTFGSAQWLPTNTMLVTLVCDGTNVFVYFNGILSGTYIAQPYAVSHPIKFMAEHSLVNSIVNDRSINRGALRFARIHQKALSQNEVTNSFNAYEKLGLFTESGLPPESTIPNYAIIDEEGNYLTDEDGNFITWE